MFFSVSVFGIANRYFWKKYENLSFWKYLSAQRLNLVYFKVAPLDYSGLKTSEAAGFILVFAVILKWHKIHVKRPSVHWSCSFYIPILCKVLITSLKCLKEGFFWLLKFFPTYILDQNSWRITMKEYTVKKTFLEIFSMDLNL